MKLITPLFTLFLCFRVLSQTPFYTLTPINDLPVKGEYNIRYDANTRKTIVSGIVTTYGINANMGNLVNNLALPYKPTSGLLIGDNVANFLQINDSMVIETTNKLDVHGAMFYVTYKNSISRFYIETVIPLHEMYTLLFTANGIPVAYGTFVPVPVPEASYMALFIGLSLISIFLINKYTSFFDGKK